MCSLSPQNLKFVHLFSCSAGNGPGERLRNVLKCKTQVQRHCFCSSKLLLCVVLAAVVVAVAKASYSMPARPHYLSAWYRSAFPCDHPRHLQSCALIGPHTSTCPGEQSIGLRGMTHLLHIEAEIRVSVLDHVPGCDLVGIE